MKDPTPRVERTLPELLLLLLLLVLEQVWFGKKEGWTGVPGYDLEGVVLPEMERASFSVKRENLYSLLVSSAATFSTTGEGGISVGWLYIHVAANTVMAPIKKPMVILNSKRTTLARKLRTILRLVAKPLRILSEYLMTTAVRRPPSTWIKTVAQAQGPKLWKRESMKPCWGLLGAYRMGRSAGMREKRDSCTFRTHRSVFEPLRTISK